MPVPLLELSSLHNPWDITYKRLISYIIDDLGHIWLDKLTPQQVQAFYTKMLTDKLSSKVVHEIHGVLHLALKNAVRWGMISRNVCDLVSPPRIVSREVVPLSVGRPGASPSQVHPGPPI